MSIEARADLREPKLWWVAGADARILARCPRADQLVVQHLALSLIGAFLFIFLVTSASMLVAFPDLSASPVGIATALGFALLVAGMVFLIDRLFIQADWDWQALVQRRALARAAWEKGGLDDKLGAFAREFGPRRSALLAVRRYTVVFFRILLSMAIALTIASFLELVIYKQEIRITVERLHYEDNRAVYDEIGVRTLRLDSEIAGARGERDRLQQAANEVEAELGRLELAPPPLPSDRSSAQIEGRMADLRGKLADEEAKVRQYNESMIAELRGTRIHPGDTGLQGQGPRYLTLVELRNLSQSTIVGYRTTIADLETQRRAALGNRDAEYEAARTRLERQKSGLRQHLADTSAALAGAQGRLSELEGGREGAIAEFTATLKNRPDFVPISFGIASQIRALRALYWQYGSTFEMIMIKLLIMMLEMTPVLQKVFFSPVTLYAVRLDAARRGASYEHFNEEVRQRQELLKRKADAAWEEELDAQGIERVRRGNVTPLHESRGAG